METRRRKNVECPLSEGLKHNERSSSLQIMAVKPVMLKGRQSYLVTLGYFKFNKNRYAVLDAVQVRNTWH